MKKEFIIAISAGLLIGGILVGGILTANQALQNNSNSLVSANATPSQPTAKDNEKGEIPLNLVAPQDLLLTKTGKTSIEGKTLANTHILIQSETDTFYLKSDDQGTFSQEVSLSSGSNDLTVTALTDTGESSTKTVSVVYSTATI